MMKTCIHETNPVHRLIAMNQVLRVHQRVTKKPHELKTMKTMKMKTKMMMKMVKVKMKTVRRFEEKYCGSHDDVCFDAIRVQEGDERQQIRQSLEDTKERS